jgi:hypothetical protein
MPARAAASAPCASPVATEPALADSRRRKLRPSRLAPAEPGRTGANSGSTATLLSGVVVGMGGRYRRRPHLSRP